MMNCRRYNPFFLFFMAFLLRGPIGVAQTPPRTANLQLHLDYPINHLLPDPKGFLWLATDRGLVRYDGSTTEVYTHDPKNPQSLPMNRLTYLLRDDQTGLIWIATGNAGLVCFNPKLPKNKAFTTYLSVPNDPKTIGGNALGVLEMDDNRHLWIGGDNAALTELDLSTRQFTRHTEGVDSTLYSVVNGGNNRLWLGTRSRGLCLYDTRLQKVVQQWDFKQFLPQNYDFQNALNAVGGIVLAADKSSLWCTSSPLGLVHLNIKTNEIHAFSLGFSPFDIAKENNTTAIERAADGKLWVGHTQEGLAIFDPQTQKVERHLVAESDRMRRKLPFRITKIHTDKHRQTWIGTTKGLFSYSPLKNVYTQLTPLPIGPNKVLKIVENTYTNDRDIWLLTDKNVVKMDGRSHRITARFAFPKEIVINKWSNLTIQPSGVYVHSVNCMSRIDEKTGKINPLPIQYDITGITDDTLPDGEPIRWISTYNAGLFRLRQNNVIENFRHLPNNILISIHRTRDGVIWLCADNGGLLRLNDKAKVGVDQFLNNPQMPNSLPDNIPICFYTDAQNRLWCGTASNGLVRIDNPNATTPIFHQYSLDSKENPFVSGICEDADGNFWVNANQAKPYIFKPQTGESHQLKGDGSDILPDRLAENSRIGQGKNGIWFTNTEGVVFMDKTNDYVFPKRTLPVSFTGLTIFDKDETGRLTDSTVQLSYKENFFSLQFSALNFDENTQYRYKLDGVDKDWVNIGSRNIAYYTDLPNGVYTFRVRAYVGVAADDDTETTLQIVITPPFWKMGWFRILAIGLSVGLLFLFYQNRLRQIQYESDLKQKEAEIKQKEAETAQLRAEFQQKIAETELSALRAQMNPHFIFNCLNSLNLYILENHIDLASDYLQRFAKLIRLVLENSRLERIPLSNEVESLKLYMTLEGMRFKEKLIFIIHIDPQIDLEMVEIPPLLLQPFVENAIWHGLMQKVEGGTIWLTITQPTEAMIHAEITDNGIGRAASADIKSKSATRQKSFGMKVTGERIAAINQIYHTATKAEVVDLFDENGAACGTKVMVDIPI